MYLFVLQFIDVLERLMGISLPPADVPENMILLLASV
jgi:hypothetical protein